VLVWTGATLAVAAAAFVGLAAPDAVFRLTGLGRGHPDQTHMAWLVLAAIQAYVSAMAAVAVAYLLAPSRSGTFASVVFIVGALYCVWILSWANPDPPQVNVGLFLSGCVGGISALASCIAVRHLRARVPNKPLQPTSGGRAPGEGGSMGDAARG
jgi:hypothetical protein